MAKLPLGYDEASYEKLDGKQKMMLQIRMTINTVFFLWFPLSNFGWTLLFGLSHGLFWPFGFTAVEEFGYTDRGMYDSAATGLGEGGIASGPSGSGVFVVTLMLTVPVTMIYVMQGYEAFLKFGGKFFRETEYVSEDDVLASNASS